MPQPPPRLLPPAWLISKCAPKPPWFRLATVSRACGKTSLERVLSEQSSAIASLRASAAETDVNLQRLIVSINRLCEVAPTVPPTPAPRPPEPIVAGRPQLVKESERESKRPRIPMSRIFGALLAFGLSRFFHN
jgi:hypothetical protein